MKYKIIENGKGIEIEETTTTTEIYSKEQIEELKKHHENEVSKYEEMLNKFKEEE